MKNIIKVLVAAALVSFMAVSCNSDAAALKKLTKKVNKLTEQVEKANTAEEITKFAADCKNFEKEIPENLKNMSEEELVKVDGWNDFEAALEKFADASAKAAARIAGGAE